MKLVFAGTPEFAAAHLGALIGAGLEPAAVVTQPDKPGKRGRKPVASAVKRLAETKGITTVQPERLRASDIEPFDPDLIIVVAYGQILRRDVLDLPGFGCVNVHASILPRWRGAAPIQRALLAGDTQSGVCTMRMDEGLDTGDVYECRRIAVDPRETTASLTKKLEQLGGATLIDTINAIADGTASPVAQTAEGVTYANKVGKAEARIDWRFGAVAIDRAVRAFNPEPVAFSQLGELRIRVWETRVGDGAGTPGEILAADKSGIEVACGQGSIKIERLQLPVGKGTVMTAADVLNARAGEFASGNRFE